MYEGHNSEKAFSWAIRLDGYLEKSSWCMKSIAGIKPCESNWYMSRINNKISYFSSSSKVVRHKLGHALSYFSHT